MTTQQSQQTNPLPPAPNNAGYVPVPDENNIHTLGILSLVFSFFVALAGLIIGIVGKSKSKKFTQATGQKANGDGLLTAGIIVSSISLGFVVLWGIISIAFAGAIFGGLKGAAEDIVNNGEIEWNINNTITDKYKGYVCEDEGGYDWSFLYNSPEDCASIDGNWYYKGN